MNDDRWKQIDELFDAALDLPESEREEFLAQKTNGDAELKNKLLKLLKATDAADFMEKSAMGIAARHLAQTQTFVMERQLIGQKFGSYVIEQRIGAGGMGEVFLARDEKLDRNIALKILPGEYTTDDERVKRFEMEARAVSALNHPNIVTIHDVGSENGVNFIATEYVEGKTVRALIGEKPRLVEILNIMFQVCDALAAAHAGGIIHRDIKPENIMLRPDGYVKILDFGLAKLSAAETNPTGNVARTAKGVIIGTPAYMSPEQVTDGSVDHRTDLWSVGVVLYELLTGFNPYKKESRQATFQSILLDEPPLASTINAEVSGELDRILYKALDKDPVIGYQTAADLRAELKRVRREFDSTSGRKIPFMRRRKDAISQRIFLVFTFALLLFTARAAIWYFAGRSEQSGGKEATEWATAQNTQLTNSPAAEGYPSFSPDGKNVIFEGGDNNDRNIFSQRIGGKNLQNLTAGSTENDTMPAFSPDGKLIAFRSERKPRGIYVMEETGENVRRLTDFGFHPSWSPDGEKIVVSDRPSDIHTSHTIPNSRLWTIDTASGEKRQIETGGDAVMPSWSPNGRRIAFWYVAAGNPGEIATVPADGGDPVIIASDAAAADWNPVWSPDGKYLYFASNRRGNMNFWRVPVDEKTGRQLGEPESVSMPSKYSRHLAISRDGKRLGYVRYESNSNLQSLAFNPKTLKTAGEANWITRGNIEISNPQLSPNGEEFLVRHPDNVQEDLAILDRDGKNWRNLTKDRFHERNARWSPDGKQVAFQTDRTGKYQIWMIDADGANPRQITYTEKNDAVLPVFSPDGKRLVFTENEGSLRRPFILDLTIPWNQQTPQPLPPLETNFYATAVDWSKDGKKLLLDFFELGGSESGIALFDFETSKYEKITASGTLAFWLNDNRHFIFSSRNSASLGDTKTKKITELFKPTAYELQNANISPDNQMIFFRYLQIDADIWLLDNTFNQ
jgi:eukaryotic-like serine/threonine-protein kinase